MRLLILGGTGFFGRHLTAAACARGNTVTLFHRGKTNPELFPDVEHLYGERDGNLGALQGRQWDTVIDTCGYLPRVVQASAEVLADAVTQYIYISTMMVYAGIHEPPIQLLDESAPVIHLDDPWDAKLSEHTYGPLKAACEQEIEAVLPGRTLSIRPCIIVGPYDPTDRFAYWVHRIAVGGEVAAPGSPRRPIQYIDVRDLAEWTLFMSESRAVGVYNAIGPRPMFDELLTTMNVASKNKATVTWLDEHFLRETHIIPEGQLPYRFPFWMPPTLPGFFSMSNVKALANGLKLRPMATTIQDTLNWIRTDPPEFGRQRKYRLTPDEEQQIMALWNETGS